MERIVIDIIPIILLLLFLTGMKPVHPLKEINEDYLSLDTCKNLRGLLAMIIVIHHYAQTCETGFLIMIIEKAGYMAVAVFFFLSGYGLQKSYLIKKERYKYRFLIRRIPTILLPYAIMTCVWWALFFVSGKRYSLADVFIAIAKGNPIMPSSWFIITILLFYFAFWFLMIIFNHYSGMLAGAGVWTILYVAFCVYMGYGAWWYNTVHLLVIGMVWAVYESKIADIIKNKIYLIPIIWVCFVICAVFGDGFSEQIPNPASRVIFKSVTSLLFVLSIVTLSMKIKIGNAALNFLGAISFEIYLVHGLFVRIFRGDTLHIYNEFLGGLVVISGTIVSAFVFHWVMDKVLYKIKK